MKKNITKKLLIGAMIIMGVASTSITTYAATPALKIPSIKIPDISNSVKNNIELELSDNFWDNWFKEHPLNIDFSKINIKFN